MSVTEPWSPRAPGLLNRSLRHAHTVTAHTSGGDIALQVVSGTLTMDDGHQPRMQGRLACRLPTTQADLDALDPRAGVRVSIDGGYVLPGLRDVHRLATLDLHQATSQRPQDVLLLDLQGRELRYQQPAVSSSPSWNVTVDIYTALVWLIRSIEPAAVVDSHSSTLGPVTSDPLAPVQLLAGDEPWALMTGLAARAGVDLWDDGTSWRIAPTPTDAGQVAAFLTTGPTGSITGSESARMREGWANYVRVHLANGATGYASVDDGPFGTIAAGRRAAAPVHRPETGTGEDAQRVALGHLRYLFSRGRALSVQAAHAAYWVRPGDTVQAQLPIGPPEKHLVSRLDIDLPSGAWHVTTRQPYTAPITTGA